MKLHLNNTLILIILTLKYFIYSTSLPSSSSPSPSSSSSSSSSLSFNKIPNSFIKDYNILNKNTCLQILLETRLLLPLECSQYNLNQFESNNQVIRNILITGTARSGTTMVAAMSSLLGISISNDAQPPTFHGTASWHLASQPQYDPNCHTSNNNNNNNNKYNNLQHSKLIHIPSELEKQNKQEELQHIPSKPFLTVGEQRQHLRFRNIFHQVRNPLDCIPSLLTEISHWKKCQSVISQIIPNFDFTQSREVMALQMWIEWNKRLDQFSFIPVHRVEDFNLLDLLMSAGYVYQKHMRMTDRDYICAYHKFRGYNSRSESHNTGTKYRVISSDVNKKVRSQTSPTSIATNSEKNIETNSERNENINLKPKLRWDHLYVLNSTLTLEAMDMAYRYGYRYYYNSTLIPMKIKTSKFFSKPENKFLLNQISYDGYSVLSAHECSRILSGRGSIQSNGFLNHHFQQLQQQQQFSQSILRPRTKKIPQLNLPEITIKSTQEILSHPIFNFQ